MPIAVFSTLPEETEELIHQTIGCALEVHRELGAGFLERIYTQALRYELEARGIPYECERPIVVNYKEHHIGGRRVDLIVGNESCSKQPS